MAERCPGVCPICAAYPVEQVGPELWNCTSVRCNSQFYIDDEGLLNVRDRVDRRLMKTIADIDAGDLMILITIIIAAIIYGVMRHG